MKQERELNHGDHQPGMILPGRVQRDRRPSVIGVAGDGYAAVVGDVLKYQGRIGLGIAPGRGDTALFTISDFRFQISESLISVAGAAEKSTTNYSALLLIGTPRAAVGGVRAFDFTADHEARGIPEIVSEGRPQAVRTANRIARAEYGGVMLVTAGDASRVAGKTQSGETKRRRKAFWHIITNGTTGCRRERPVEGKIRERVSVRLITGNRDTATGLDTAGDQLVRRAVLHALPQGNKKPTVIHRSLRVLRHATILGTFSPSVDRFGVLRFHAAAARLPRGIIKTHKG